MVKYEYTPLYTIAKCVLNMSNLNTISTVVEHLISLQTAPSVQVKQSLKTGSLP